MKYGLAGTAPIRNFWNPLQRFLASEIASSQNTPAGARWALMSYCFLSGFVACVSFSACSIWVGFQSGNTIQVVIAISRTVFDRHRPHQDFRINDYQALCSLGCFAVAAQIAGRLLPYRPNTRGRVILATMLQIVCTAIAAVTASFTLNRGRPSWHNSYGFATIAMLSTSFGIQGVTADPFGTGFGATVVLTTTWVQVGTITWPWRACRPRDERVLAILLFMLGAFLSRLLLAVTGSGATLAIGAGLRALIIPMWMACPAKVSEEPPDVEKPFTNRIVMTRSNDSMATVVNE